MRRVLIAALVALGCGTACERSESTRCSLGEAAQVVRSDAARFDAIALASDGTRAVAAWSESGGSYARLLDRDASPPRALGQRCAGGIAGSLTQRALWIACLAPGADQAPGTLQLLQLDPRTLAQRGPALELAHVEANAHHVALAASATQLHVVWGDGAVGRPRLFARALSLANGQLDAPRALSRPEANAREPSLLLHQEKLWIAWTESDITPGKVRHRLMLQRGSQPAAALGEVVDEAPQPALGRDADGPLLTFRTAKKRDARAELFVARIDVRTGRFTLPPRSIGRANGAGGPNLALCERTRAISVPFDHAGELSVAFHPLSRALTTTEENHQYYESEREFVASASACVGGYPMALMAEQTEPSRPRARLLATAFRCDK